MSANPCPRLFEAEAMRDGRLGGAARASFERHVITCPACSRENKALEALSEALRASSPDDADKLHVRRERTRLLRAFDGVLVAPEGHHPRQRRLWLAAAAALFLGLLVLWRIGGHAAPPGQASSALVRADGAAVWSRRMDGTRERVVLERGALWVRVDHSAGESRLVVVLPDGELEDIGTTFAVSAEDGHTTRVSVQEGHVVLRLHGRSPVTLGPGDTWIPDVPAPVACVGAGPPPAPVSRAQPAPVVASARPPRSSAPLASALAPDSLADFRAAMGALDVGDNHEAAVRFASFLEKHPQDPRAEDAAYSRVIALQRSGDTRGMKEAAEEYLRRFPAGFRRAEMDRLSR